MLDALQVLRFSLRDFWDEFVWLAMLNLLWSLTIVLPFVPPFLMANASLPLALVASLLLALPLPIVSGGLAFVTNQVSRGKVVGWGVFVTGVRRYWAKSLLVAAINLVVLSLILANVQFYGSILQGAWTNIALSVWLVVGIYWLLTQIFWFPMILELETEKVLLALRNALLMVIVTPGFSITLGAVMLVLVVLCVGLSVPAMVIMGSLLLLIANHATRSRLAHARKQPYKPGIDLDK
jgi:hypothetical protein